MSNFVFVSDSEPLENQWVSAYEEMDAAELSCDHCMKSQITFVKKCGIFDGICIPIPNNQPASGYIQAMIGLQEYDVDKIIAGCKEEEAIKGNYLAHSYILRAYTNAVINSSPTNFGQEYSNDIRRLNRIILDEECPENIKFHARLCRANLYMRKSKFKDADRDFDVLEEKHHNNALVYVIKSGAMMQLSLHKKEFIEPLKICCSLHRIYMTFNSKKPLQREELVPVFE